MDLFSQHSHLFIYSHLVIWYVLNNFYLDLQIRDAFCFFYPNESNVSPFDIVLSLNTALILTIDAVNKHFQDHAN